MVRNAARVPLSAPVESGFDARPACLEPWGRVLLCSSDEEQHDRTDRSQAGPLDPPPPLRARAHSANATPHTARTSPRSLLRLDHSRRRDDGHVHVRAGAVLLRRCLHRPHARRPRPAPQPVLAGLPRRHADQRSLAAVRRPGARPPRCPPPAPGDLPAPRVGLPLDGRRPAPARALPGPDAGPMPRSGGLDADLHLDGRPVVHSAAGDGHGPAGARLHVLLHDLPGE